MCGIAGQVGGRAVAALDDSVLDALRHRGPDAQCTERCAMGDVIANFAFARLAIVDLSDAGQQPMGNEDGRFTMVFNGEIYNSPALRNECERPSRPKPRTPRPGKSGPGSRRRTGPPRRRRHRQAPDSRTTLDRLCKTPRATNSASRPAASSAETEQQRSHDKDSLRIARDVNVYLRLSCPAGFALVTTSHMRFISTR